MNVRGMVCYSDLNDAAKLGLIQPCPCNTHVKTKSVFLFINVVPVRLLSRERFGILNAV